MYFGKNSNGDNMKHDIDLQNFNVRSDLAIDCIDNTFNLKGINKRVKSINDIIITDVKLDKDNALNKKQGFYITIEFKDVTDTDNYNNVYKVVIDELLSLLDKMHIKDNNTCLIVGLGNQNSTPDSLGPLVIDNVLVTNHIYELGELGKGYRRVSAIAPGVSGQTGIETTDIIKSIVDKIKPDFLIAIDSLASQSIDRVNKTIQMTNTGIHPGSGIGNSRKEVSFDTIGIPVLAIGIPTVVDASVIVSDTINYMYKHYAFIKEYQKLPQSKLTFNNVNYLNKDIRINNEDKQKLLGLIGNLNEEEVRELIYEVLSPIGYNLMVTPKEIDFVIVKLSELITQSLNSVLHKKNRA